MNDLTEWINGLEKMEPLPINQLTNISQAKSLIPQQMCVYYEQPHSKLPEIEDEGRWLAPDNRGKFEMYVYYWTQNGLKKKRFCNGIIKFAIKIIINMPENAEVWYCIIVENVYTREFLISERDLMKTIETFRIFSENGIAFSYTARDAIVLLHNYIFSVVKEIKEYPYSPGWHGNSFLYNKDIPAFTDTPFFRKKLLINNDITQKKAFDMLIDDICKIEDKALRLFILLFLHYALLASKIKILKVNSIFALFGEEQIIKNVGYLFFQFYNKDKVDVNYLYDSDVLKKMSECKDEIFLITDKYPDTKYKKQLAEKNLSDIKDFVESGECNCLCLILSNHGILEANQDVFHFVVNQKIIEASQLLTESLGTHISYFISWTESKINTFENVKIGDCTILYDSLAQVYNYISKYYEYIGGRELFSQLDFVSDNEVFSVLRKMVSQAYNDYQGSWICERFEYAFKKLNFKRVYNFDENVSFHSEEPFTYITKKYVCFREKDFNLFLKYFPEEMRRNDILRTLKRFEKLATDDEKRFQKNIWFQGEPRKMIVFNKEFLIPFDSVEGGII